LVKAILSQRIIVLKQTTDQSETLDIRHQASDWKKSLGKAKFQI
jgi:hypothetical protein